MSLLSEARNVNRTGKEMMIFNSSSRLMAMAVPADKGAQFRICILTPNGMQAVKTELRTEELGRLVDEVNQIRTTFMDLQGWVDIFMRVSSKELQLA